MTSLVAFLILGVVALIRHNKAFIFNQYLKSTRAELKIRNEVIRQEHNQVSAAHRNSLSKCEMPCPFPNTLSGQRTVSRATTTGKGRVHSRRHNREGYEFTRTVNDNDSSGL